jgi:hypothetical protein
MMDKKHITKYNTNLAAEFHVLSCLHRLGLEAALTLGNKKAVDIFIFKPDGKPITIDVKGVAKKYPWPADNLKVNGKENHYIVLVCFNGKIEDPKEPPSVWVVPSIEIGEFVQKYKTRSVVSRSKIVNEGDKYYQAWGALKEKETKCSQVAEYYYNQDKWVKGSGTELVVSQMELLCKQGKTKISREELINVVTIAYPEKKNIKDRVIKVVLWARSPEYKLIDEEDGVITIKRT